MIFWCLRFHPKNERKQVDLRYHSSKDEFFRSFFGGNWRHQKPFRNYLTFIYCLTLVQSIISWLVWAEIECMSYWLSRTASRAMYRHASCPGFWQTVPARPVPWQDFELLSLSLSPETIKELLSLCP